jgi:hypothetical protein
MIYVPLDPLATVVLFADLQAGIIERVTTNELTHLRRAVSALAKLTKLFDIPAVLTTAPSEGGAPRVTVPLYRVPAVPARCLPILCHLSDPAMCWPPVQDVTYWARDALHPVFAAPGASASVSARRRSPLHALRNPIPE